MPEEMEAGVAEEQVERHRKEDPDCNLDTEVFVKSDRPDPEGCGEQRSKKHQHRRGQR